MTTPATHAQHLGREYRLPLPGAYPVLTMQLNATLHLATGLGKFVTIVREPSAHDEIARTFHDLAVWTQVYPRALAAATADLDALGTLMGIPSL